ncbi:MAG: hypothetical protein IPK74_32040 [Deltaproteobacteria bacterium]|nr:hypothetical protein [Deltaproteobacteria bacterium]
MSTPSSPPAAAAAPGVTTPAPRGRVHRLAWVLVGAAAVETVATAWFARDPLDDAAWSQLADTIAARDEPVPLLLADEWLGPSARMHVPALREPDALMAPDLHGVARFDVIGLGRDWSDALDVALEGLPRPHALARVDVGPFTWTRYEQPAARLVNDLTASAIGREIATDTGPCRGRDRGRCDEGEVGPRIVEIDYRPRACLGMTVKDGTPVTVRWPDVALGDRLRGHLGAGDYNARLRNDAPIDLVVRIDGELVRRTTIADLEGWRAFEIATTPGPHALEITVTAALSGSFTARGYDVTPQRTICLELRALEGNR